jgi:hypothetical protein
MKLGLWLLLLAFVSSAQQGSGGSTQRGLVQPSEPANTLRDRGTRWALVVGISSYQYLPPDAQLQFAHRDAEQFASFLRDAPGGALPAEHIRLLIRLLQDRGSRGR